MSFLGLFFLLSGSGGLCLLLLVAQPQHDSESGSLPLSAFNVKSADQPTNFFFLLELCLLLLDVEKIRFFLFDNFLKQQN